MIPSEGTHTAQDTHAVDQQIWRDGVKLLLDTGGKEREVRSLLAQLAKVHGQKALATAIVDTKAANPVDPRSYLIKMLRDRTSRTNVGRSELEDAPPPACSECNDLKKVMRPKPNRQFDWEMVQIDCPDCIGGAQ
jgi:hypothetical protein